MRAAVRLRREHGCRRSGHRLPAMHGRGRPRRRRGAIGRSDLFFIVPRKSGGIIGAPATLFPTRPMLVVPEVVVTDDEAGNRGGQRHVGRYFSSASRAADSSGTLVLRTVSTHSSGRSSVSPTRRSRRLRRAYSSADSTTRSRRGRQIFCRGNFDDMNEIPMTGHGASERRKERLTAALLA
jgi:hypothetical protein